MRPNQQLGELTGRILSGLDRVLAAEQPDWVVVQGDTTTSMAAALAAYYRQIPVAHVEAGLRTDNKYSPFPEEINRRLISVLADRHFAPTPWLFGIFAEKESRRGGLLKPATRLRMPSCGPPQKTANIRLRCQPGFPQRKRAGSLSW